MEDPTSILALARDDSRRATDGDISLTRSGDVNPLRKEETFHKSESTRSTPGRWRPEPPVTKATLSELDVTKIIHNPKLRHDIDFDPELHFRPERDSQDGWRTLEKESEPWATLADRLKSVALKFTIRVLDVTVHQTQPLRSMPAIVDSSTAPAASKYQGLPDRISQLRIYGRVLGRTVVSLPDSGADGCYISQALAEKLRLSTTPGTGRQIKFANNTDLQSPGSVEVSWQFLGEGGTYPMVCWILPDCGCNVDVILGHNFLKATKTSICGPRVQKTYIKVPRSVSVKFLGEGKQRLWGCLNGDLVPALPDTGSDIMLISKAYAKKLGLQVDSDPGDMVEVEFPNGSTARTDGIVRNVPWSVGDHTIRCDFFVLDNLRVDVILSKDYLYDHDVFAKHEDLLTDDEATDHLLDFYNIRLLRTFGPALEKLAEESIEDMTSPDAFCLAMVNREWARQDRILDEIESLPIDQRDRAREEEAERQRQWKEARAEHERRWAQIRASSNASSVAGGPQTSGGLAQECSPQTEPPSRRPKRRRFRISIPLLPLRGSAHSGQSD